MRRPLLLIAVLTSVAALTACSSGDDSAQETATQTATQTAAALSSSPRARSPVGPPHPLPPVRRLPAPPARPEP